MLNLYNSNKEKNIIILFSQKKKNELLTFVTAWMDPEGIMLNEVNQREKYCMSSLICGIKIKTKIIDMENRVVIARGGGRG